MNITEGTIQNPLYLAYGSGVFNWPMFLVSVGYAILAIIEIPLNFSLCWITLKYRKVYSSLSSNTSILLAMSSFFEILHQSSNFTFFVIAVSGTNFIASQFAVILEAHSIVGLCSATTLLPLLSVDRLLAVAAPIFYRNLNRKIYIGLCLLLIFTYNTWVAHYFLKAMQQFPNWPVTGAIYDLFQNPGMGSDNYYIVIWILVATVVVYVLVGVLVKCKTNITSEKMKKLYNSLFLIVFINVGSYLISILYNCLYFAGIIQLSPVQYWFVNNFIAFLLNFGEMANAVVLYKNSKEYKSAYLAEFEWLKLRLNAVNPLSNSQTIRVMPAQNANQMNY